MIFVYCFYPKNLKTPKYPSSLILFFSTTQVHLLPTSSSCTNRHYSQSHSSSASASISTKISLIAHQFFTLSPSSYRDYTFVLSCPEKPVELLTQLAMLPCVQLADLCDGDLSAAEIVEVDGHDSFGAQEAGVDGANAAEGHRRVGDRGLGHVRGDHAEDDGTRGAIVVGGGLRRVNVVRGERRGRRRGGRGCNFGDCGGRIEEMGRILHPRAF